MTGHAYVVWTDAHRGEVYFATNGPSGITEEPTQQLKGVQPSAAVIRKVLYLPKPQATSLKPRARYGRREAMDLRPGPNDVSRLVPGVYFIQLGFSSLTDMKKAVVVR